MYQSKDHELLSWYQAHPAKSLTLIESCCTDRDASVLDVGGGSSLLVDRLLELGHTDVTVADVSPTALAHSRARLGAISEDVTWIECDVTNGALHGPYAVWHDRAVFHFLTDPSDQRQYVSQIRRVIPRGGHVIIAAFALDGPDTCSGLPVQRYGEESLGRALGGEFEGLTFVLDAHETPHGSIQNFQYGLFRRTTIANNG